MPTLSQNTKGKLTYQNPKVLSISDSLIKAKALKEFIEEFSSEQRTEISMITSEIKFYEGTLVKLKSVVRKLRRTRDRNVKDYISDKITSFSKSSKAHSEIGSNIYNRNEYRSNVFSPPRGVSLKRNDIHMKTTQDGCLGTSQLYGSDRGSIKFQNRYSKPEIGLADKYAQEKQLREKGKLRSLSPQWQSHLQLRGPSLGTHHHSRLNERRKLERGSIGENYHQTESLRILKKIKRDKKYEGGLSVSPSLKGLRNKNSPKSIRRHKSLEKLLNRGEQDSLPVNLVETTNKQVPGFFQKNSLALGTIDPNASQSDLKIGLNSSRFQFGKREFNKYKNILDETDELEQQTYTNTDQESSKEPYYTTHNTLDDQVISHFEHENTHPKQRNQSSESQPNLQNQTTMTFFSAKMKKKKGSSDGKQLTNLISSHQFNHPKETNKMNHVLHTPSKTTTQFKRASKGPKNKSRKHKKRVSESSKMGVELSNLKPFQKINKAGSNYSSAKAQGHNARPRRKKSKNNTPSIFITEKYSKSKWDKLNKFKNQESNYKNQYLQQAPKTRRKLQQTKYSGSINDKLKRLRSRLSSKKYQQHSEQSSKNGASNSQATSNTFNSTYIAGFQSSYTTPVSPKIAYTSKFITKKAPKNSQLIQDIPNQELCPKKSQKRRSTKPVMKMTRTRKSKLTELKSDKVNDLKVQRSISRLDKINDVIKRIEQDIEDYGRGIED